MYVFQKNNSCIKKPCFVCKFNVSMEVCQVFVSSDLIGSFVVTFFAHAQHARRFPGCHLFSKLWEVPQTVRCHLQSYIFKQK